MLHLVYIPLCLRFITRHVRKRRDAADAERRGEGGDGGGRRAVSSPSERESFPRFSSARLNVSEIHTEIRVRTLFSRLLELTNANDPSITRVSRVLITFHSPKLPLLKFPSWIFLLDNSSFQLEIDKTDFREKQRACFSVITANRGGGGGAYCHTRLRGCKIRA